MPTGRHSLASPRHLGASARKPPRLRIWPLLVAALVLTMSAGVVRATLQVPVDSASTLPQGPPRAGYFRTEPAGSWHDLPGDTACARRVRRSDWEPRPGNHLANHTMPDQHAVTVALTSRPRGRDGSYDSRWNSWLLPRVSGQHTGTTDENIQWAACKWGISDNLLRAVTALESRWFQQAVDPATGRCVETRGCNDLFTSTTPAAVAYCQEISRYGHDYTEDYAPGRCPRTFSIAGVMAWQDPQWGRMRRNQNGTFPFSRDSTAYALDYLGSFLRGCQEGWLPWLDETGDRSYAAGDLWGCVGTWYAGAWKVPAAEEYVVRVRELLDGRVWLDPRWVEPPSPPTG